MLINPFVVLYPVANAVAAEEESVMTESALYVDTVPAIILSSSRGFPLYQRARVCTLWEHPSGTRTITFFILASALSRSLMSAESVKSVFGVESNVAAATEPIYPSSRSPLVEKISYALISLIFI
jgi:hypothetical protein